MLFKIFISILFCFLCFTKIEAQVDTNCSRNQFDEDLSKTLGIFGVKGVDFPDNEEDMERYCSLAKRTNENITKEFIDRCLKGYSKTVMFIFNNNLKTFLKQVCGDNSTERQNFIEWAECGNKGKDMGNNRCWNRLMTNLYKTRHVEEAQERIPVMCCNFLTWKSCTLKILKNVDECDESAVDGFEQLIQKSTLEPLQALCDEYFEDPTLCIDVLELIPEFKPSQRRRVDNRTPFLALFKLFDSLH